MSGFEHAVIIERGSSLAGMVGTVEVVKKTRSVLSRRMRKAFCINSGDLPPAFGDAGDYLLQDSSGGLYVCKSGLFEKIYEGMGRIVSWNNHLKNSKMVLVNDEPAARNAEDYANKKQAEEIDRWILRDEKLIEAWHKRLAELKAEQIAEVA